MPRCSRSAGRGRTSGGRENFRRQFVSVHHEPLHSCPFSPVPFEQTRRAPVPDFVSTTKCARFFVLFLSRLAHAGQKRRSPERRQFFRSRLRIDLKRNSVSAAEDFGLLRKCSHYPPTATPTG